MKENIKQYHETYFMIIIQTILVILKLLNVINWKWVYVFIPLYIYLAIIMFIITLVFIIVKDVPYDRNGEIDYEDNKIEKLQNTAYIDGDIAYSWSISEEKLKNKINEIIDCINKEQIMTKKDIYEIIFIFVIMVLICTFIEYMG